MEISQENLFVDISTQRVKNESTKARIEDEDPAHKTN